MKHVVKIVAPVASVVVSAWNNSAIARTIDRWVGGGGGDGGGGGSGGSGSNDDDHKSISTSSSTAQLRSQTRAAECLIYSWIVIGQALVPIGRFI